MKTGLAKLKMIMGTVHITVYAMHMHHIFAPAGHIQRHMEGTIFSFQKTKIYDLVMTATNLFGNIINIHPF